MGNPPHNEYYLEHLSPPRHSRYNILSGMSGVGKTTIGGLLTTAGYQQLRNVYTRPMRPNESERNGIFVDEITFMNWKREGRFATAKITNGVWHGLLLDELKRVSETNMPTWADKSVSSLLKLDESVYDTAQLVYILPPSFNTLWNRLTKREQGADSSLTVKEITRRLDEEIGELEQSIHLPYRYIVNDEVERVAKTLLGA